MRRNARSHTPDDVRRFFAQSDWLDRMVLRPLSHIARNWEARWDNEDRRYRPEPFSFANDLNQVVELVAICPRPSNYHNNEDALVERVVLDIKWPLQKKGRRWIGVDYAALLERGGFRDLDQRNLVAAAAGRVNAALDHGQTHFDNMEDGHLYMLAALLSIIIYHRHSSGTSLLVEVADEHHEE